MVVIITELSKILIIFLMLMYTILSFLAMKYKEEEAREGIYGKQRRFIFMMHFLGYALIYLNTRDIRVVFMYGVLLLMFALFINLYDLFYADASSIVVNNMVLLMAISSIMLTRLNFDHALRQLVFMGAGMIMCTLVPLCIHKMTFLNKLTYFYAAIGIMALLLVLVLASVTNGAKLSIDLGFIAIQPSEFVKISFVFFLSCMLYKDTSFRRVVTA